MSALAWVLSFASLLLALACPLGAAAQTFPTRPVHIVVPWPPGAVDVFIRALQPAMEQELGQSVIIDNKPGANGFIGTMQVAGAKPDGYTLLFNVSSSLLMGPLVSAEAKFDPIKDFQPITNVFEAPMVLVGKPSLPAASWPALLDWLRNNPRQAYGSPGLGSTPNVLGEMLKIATKAELVHVPYRGFAPMIQAMTGNEVALGFIAVATAKPHIMDGRLKLFAVDRGPLDDPDLSKAVSLAHTLAGFDSTPTFAGLFAPAGTPRPVVDRLNAAAVKALSVPQVRARVGLGGQRVVADTPEQFAGGIRENLAILTRLVSDTKAAGAKYD